MEQVAETWRKLVSWVVISTTLLVVVMPTSAKQCSFTTIFNFGDSNSDTGGISALFGQAPSPNGITFFHSPAGRYSDGRLIIDFIGGVSKNLFPKKKHFSEALYTFDIGQNDLTYGYYLNMTPEQVKAYIPDVVGQFSNVIRNVYGEGGRSFWIHNTGPLGCLPYVLVGLPKLAAQADKFGCAKPLNEVAQHYNLKLKEAVVQLREELPEATITYVDVYTIKYTLISHAHDYGFEQGVIACCGHGGKYNFNNTARCGATKVVNGKKVVIAKSCKNPSVRIIWDGIHYTDAANHWIFQQIVNGSFSDPHVPLNMACYSHASIHHY